MHALGRKHVRRLRLHVVRRHNVVVRYNRQTPATCLSVPWSSVYNCPFFWRFTNFFKIYISPLTTKKRTCFHIRLDHFLQVAVCTNTRGHTRGRVGACGPVTQAPARTPLASRWFAGSLVGLRSSFFFLLEVPIKYLFHFCFGIFSFFLR